MNCAELAAQTVIGIAANVMKLINGDQPIIEGSDPQFINGKAEGRVGANQHRITTHKEFADCFNLGSGNFQLIDPGRIAEIPLRLDGPIGPKPAAVSFSSAKLPPIERSGTTIIACFTPWFAAYRAR